MIDKSPKHQDDVNHIAHSIESKLHHGEKPHSALHEEFHHLAKLDTHHGKLDTHQFKKDVHSVEKKLHKDGYLPHLKIVNDHGSHIKILHSKHNFAPHEHDKHAGKLHPNAAKHLDGKHKGVLHPSDASHPKGTFHAVDRNHGKGIQHPADKPHRNTHPSDKPHLETKHPIETPPHKKEAPHLRRPPAGESNPDNGSVLPPAPDRRSFSNPGRDAAPNVDPRLRRPPVDQPPNRQELPPNELVPRPAPIDQRGHAPPPPNDGSMQPPPYQNSNRGYTAPPVPYDQGGFRRQDQSPPPAPYDQGGFRRQDQSPPPAPYDQGGFRRQDQPLPPVPFDQGGFRRQDQPQPPYGGEQLRDTDRQREFGQPGSDASKLNGRFTEIRLDQTTHAGNSPDAVMYTRADFDPSKPVHLAVYNHGFGTRVDNTLTHDQIKGMMANAEKNTVLIIPEWQQNPGSRSGASAPFQQGNKFASMVQESFNKTPGLNGIGLNNVDRIDIMSHSAGYSPTEAEIYKNPALANKVHSITLLDSLYDQHGFDRWLSSNIGDLASGRKQFYNFSNTTTNERSAAQARYVQGLLRQQGLSQNNLAVDYGSSNGQVGRHAAEMASRSIVFGRTTVAHMQIPPQYMGAVLASVNREKKQQY